MQGGELSSPALTIQNSVELGPVDLKFNSKGDRLALSSIDQSLKIYSVFDQMGDGSTLASSLEFMTSNTPA